MDPSDWSQETKDQIMGREAAHKSANEQFIDNIKDIVIEAVVAQLEDRLLIIEQNAEWFEASPSAPGFNYYTIVTRELETAIKNIKDGAWKQFLPKE